MSRDARESQEQLESLRRAGLPVGTPDGRGRRRAQLREGAAQMRSGIYDTLWAQSAATRLRPPAEPDLPCLPCLAPR